MVVAQAQSVEWDGRRLLLAFRPVHENLRQQVELRRSELEAIAERIAGQRIQVATVTASSGDEPASAPLEPPPPALPAESPPEPADLRARAMQDTRVQALLEVLPAEIRDVEEM